MVSATPVCALWWGAPSASCCFRAGGVAGGGGTVSIGRPDGQLLVSSCPAGEHLESRGEAQDGFSTARNEVVAVQYSCEQERCLPSSGLNQEERVSGEVGVDSPRSRESQRKVGLWLQLLEGRLPC